MSTSLLQVRVEDTLKDQAARVFEDLGIDTSTAVRMFLKRAVMENGIPFRMTLPKAPYKAERGYRAMMEIGEGTEKMVCPICLWMRSMPRLKRPERNDGLPTNEILCYFRHKRSMLFLSTSFLSIPQQNVKSQER